MLRLRDFSNFKSIKHPYLQKKFSQYAFFQKKSFLFIGLQSQGQFQVREILVDEWPIIVLVLVKGTRG